jgi:hemoglobin
MNGVPAFDRPRQVLKFARYWRTLARAGSAARCNRTGRDMTPTVSLYEAVGGDTTFQRLVDAFYRRIEADPVLRPIFPADFGPGKEGQFLFLTQYFGGPHRYTEQRGRPFLRMRHMPFPIGQRERDAWVGHMLTAIDEVGILEPHRSVMREYFERGATFMMNQPSG